MSKTPFMPLWVSDFLGDTLDLDAQEVGAYMLLLMAMWQQKGSLPSDSKKLQRVARAGRNWPKIWSNIQRFFVHEGDRISNKRLTQELQKVATKRAVNAQNGSLGGRANALRNQEQDQANAANSLEQSEPYPELVNNSSSPSLEVSRDNDGNDKSEIFEPPDLDEPDPGAYSGDGQCGNGSNGQPSDFGSHSGSLTEAPGSDPDTLPYAGCNQDELAARLEADSANRIAKFQLQAIGQNSYRAQSRDPWEEALARRRAAGVGQGKPPVH